MQPSTGLRLLADSTTATGHCHHICRPWTDQSGRFHNQICSNRSLEESCFRWLWILAIFWLHVPRSIASLYGYMPYPCFSRCHDPACSGRTKLRTTPRWVAAQWRRPAPHWPQQRPHRRKWCSGTWRPVLAPDQWIEGKIYRKAMGFYHQDPSSPVRWVRGGVERGELLRYPRETSGSGGFKMWKTIFMFNHTKPDSG